MTATTRKSVTRVLGQLKRDQLISIGGASLTVPQPRRSSGLRRNDVLLHNCDVCRHLILEAALGGCLNFCLSPGTMGC